MNMEYVRHGYGSVRPYLYGSYELPKFLANVFGARELERYEAEDRQAAHVEMSIGDSVLVVEAGELPAEHEPTFASVDVYVSDVDEVYQRAMAEGAVSITEPKDPPYGEHSCGFEVFDNTWWVSTILNPSSK